MTCKPPRSLTLLLFLLFISTLTFSQCWPRASKLVPDKAYDNLEGFGRAVDYKDNFAVVGAPSSDTLKSNAGVAYVFQYVGSVWKKVAALSPSDARQNQNFGLQVMFVGDDIVVSDPVHTEGNKTTGKLYIFKKPVTGWQDMSETSTLKSSDPTVMSFGLSIDSFENTMIVSASVPFSGSAITDRDGVAFIFEQQAGVWNQVAKLTDGNSTFSNFGSNVAIRKNIVVVVAEEEPLSNNSIGIGSAYVFEKNNSASWADATPVARLTKASGEISISYLGRGIAIDEVRQTVFIGDNFYSNNKYGKGFRSYVKPSGGWKNMVENASYVNYDPSFLGYSQLQFDEPYLYLSAGSSVNVFKPDHANTWNTLTASGSLINSSRQLSEKFGLGLSARNGHVLVGAPAQTDFDRDRPVVSGYPTVYEFIVPSSGWSATEHTEDNKFSYAPKSASNFTFGNAVDIDGDYAVVGAPYDNSTGQRSGAAYIYHLENGVWKKIAKLLPSDGEPFDVFGGKVAISKEYIAVTAVNKHYRDETGKVIDFNLGAVYIYKRNSGVWANATETYKLVRSEQHPDYTDNDDLDDYFGTNLDLDFPYLVVTRFQQNRRPSLGSAFIYNLSSGSEAILEATLNPSSPTTVNSFGLSVKMANNTIVIGSGDLRGWFFDNNQVFVYTKKEEKWKDATESAVLYPAVASSGYLPGISFGVSVDVNASATKIIVGAPGWYDGELFNTTDYFKGAAYIYEIPAGGWVGRISEKAMLKVPGQPAYGCMGVSVHIEDRYAVVGSPQNYFYTYGGNSIGPGRVYFYQMPEEGWKYKTPDKIIYGDEAQNAESDYFGSSVDGVYGYLMIGATDDDNQNDVDAGSVYIYTEYPFINPGQTPLCINGEPIQLSAYPSGGQWSGGGTGNVANGIFNPAVSKAGTFQIRYKVDDCDATNTLLIEVKDIPHPFEVAASDTVFFCGARNVALQASTGDGFAYKWTFSTNATSYSLLPQATQSAFKADKEGFYKVTVTNSCGAEDGTVWVGNLHPHAGADFAICQSYQAITLAGNYGGGTWSGQGITATGVFSSSAVSSGSHNLYYSVSPSQGCIYKDTVVVTVKSISTLNLTAKDANQFCYTGATQVAATPLPGVTYQWYYGENESNLKLSDAIGNTFTAHELGTLKVVASDGQCSKEAFYKLLPFFNPKIDPLFDSLSFCANAPIKLNAESIAEASYVLSHSLHGVDAKKETIGTFTTDITESGKYVLKIKSYGCEYKSPLMTAYRIPSDSVFVPNVITPNGDHINDTLEIFASEGIETFLLKIFNRSGMEVFRYYGGNRSTGWSGEHLPTGVYFWSLSYVANCSNNDSHKGTISIIR